MSGGHNEERATLMAVNEVHHVPGTRVFHSEAKTLAPRSPSFFKVYADLNSTKGSKQQNYRNL